MQQIKDILAEKKKKTLSSTEVLKLCKNQGRILTYPELAQYDDLNDAFGGKPAIILLWETRKNFGHWTCLLKQGKDKIEHFDSYAYMPDDELKFVPNHFRQYNNMMYPHLTYLLWKCGKKVEYNHDVLQTKKNNDISTCGRHCAMRIKYRDMPLPKYVKVLKGFKRMNLTPDDIVTLLTIDI